MVNEMSGEVRLFLFSILTGMLLFFIYDIEKAFRKAVHHKNSWIAIEDLFYWLFVTLFLFYLFFHFNEGVLRSYVILGSSVGMGLYAWFLRRFCFRPVFRLFLCFQKIMCFLRKLSRKGKKFFVKICIFSLKKLRKTITIVLRHN